MRRHGAPQSGPARSAPPPDPEITFDVVSGLLSCGLVTPLQAWDSLAEDGHPGKAEAVAAVRAALAEYGTRR